MLAFNPLALLGLVYAPRQSTLEEPLPGRPSHFPSSVTSYRGLSNEVDRNATLDTNFLLSIALAIAAIWLFAY